MYNLIHSSLVCKVLWLTVEGVGWRGWRGEEEEEEEEEEEGEGEGGGVTYSLKNIVAEMKHY